MLSAISLISLAATASATLQANFDSIPSISFESVNSKRSPVAPNPLDRLHYSDDFSVINPAPVFLAASRPNTLMLAHVGIGTLEGEITKVATDCSFDVYNITVACAAQPSSGTMIPIPCIVGFNATSTVSVPTSQSAEYLGGGNMLAVNLKLRNITSLRFSMLSAWLVNPRVTPVSLIIDNIGYTPYVKA